MLIDGLSRQQLHQLALNALTDPPTLAGARVFEFGDWPTRPESFPMLLVSAQKERKVAIFPGTLQFNTTITLVVVGRLVGTTPGPIGESLETLSEQILNGILLNSLIQHSVQEFRVIETDNTVRSDGKMHVGEASAVFEVAVYQEYGPIGDPLTSIEATTTIVGGSGTVEPTFEFEILPGPTIITR